jgi:hypothetical protein
MKDHVALLMYKAATSERDFLKYAGVLTEFLSNEAQIEAMSSRLRIASSSERPTFWREGFRLWVKLADDLKADIRQQTKAMSKRQNKPLSGGAKKLNKKTEGKDKKSKIQQIIKAWKSDEQPQMQIKRLKGLVPKSKKPQIKGLTMKWRQEKQQGKFKNERGREVKFNSLPKEDRKELTFKNFVLPLMGLAKKEEKGKKKDKEEKDLGTRLKEFKGKKENDAEKLKNFMDKASPEVKERMKNMDPKEQKEFMEIILNKGKGKKAPAPAPAAEPQATFEAL